MLERHEIRNVNNPLGVTIDYVPYELPRHRIEFPRKDTRDSVLAMAHLKEPLSTARGKEKYGEKNAPAIPWLDELNKELFNKRGTGHVLQVIANKPQTIFYILAAPNTSAELHRQIQFAQLARRLQDNPRPESFMASWMGATNMDRFVEYCQMELAKDFRVTFLEGLGESYNRKILNPNVSKQFDTDAPSR